MVDWDGRKEKCDESFKKIEVEKKDWSIKKRTYREQIDKKKEEAKKANEKKYKCKKGAGSNKQNVTKKGNRRERKKDWTGSLEGLLEEIEERAKINWDQRRIGEYKERDKGSNEEAKKKVSDEDRVRNVLWIYATENLEYNWWNCSV